MSDPKQFTSDLLRAVREKAEGNLTADDVTVLLFRPNGTVKSVKLRNKFLAPLRILKGAIQSLAPAGAPAPWPQWSIANIGGAMFARLSRLRTLRIDRAE